MSASTEPVHELGVVDVSPIALPSTDHTSDGDMWLTSGKCTDAGVCTNSMRSPSDTPIASTDSSRSVAETMMDVPAWMTTIKPVAISK